MNASRPKAANSVNWEDLKDEFGFSAQEAAEVEQRTAAMLSEVRAYRLAEVRKRQKMTQTAVARTLGVTQGRISAMENGAISRSEVETLAAHVAALGGSSSWSPISATNPWFWAERRLAAGNRPPDFPHHPPTGRPAPHEAVTARPQVTPPTPRRTLWRMRGERGEQP